jgi:hypothetical protein
LLTVLACNGAPKPKPRPPQPSPIPVVVDRIPCSLPIFDSPPVMWGVPDPSAPVGPSGLPIRWILTTDTIADLGAYIHSLAGWIRAAQVCLEGK